VKTASLDPGFWCRMPKGDSDSYQEFAGTERLGQVVVRPSVKAIILSPSCSLAEMTITGTAVHSRSFR